LITLVNIIICFLAGFIYATRFSRFSPFPVNGLTTFYHCSDDMQIAVGIKSLKTWWSQITKRLLHVFSDWN